MGLNFHHCHLQIRSIEESLIFFCDRLGLVELDRKVIESAGLTLLYLAAPDDVSSPRQIAMLELAYYHDNREISDGTRFAHIAFRVDDLDRFCGQLEQQGVAIPKAPDGDPYAYVQSPDGLLVELIQAQGTSE